MFVAFLVFPFVAALLGFLLPGRGRLGVLVASALVHVGLVAAFWVHRPAPLGGELLALDDLGLVILSVVSVVFALVSLYTPTYLRCKGTPATGVYVACCLGLLGSMSLAACTLHLGILWVAVEASTLASAPLIAHRTTPAKLEATWKYLVLCSVGVSLALLGTFFLGIGATLGPNPVQELTTSALLGAAPRIPAAWLRVAFVLLLVGYGTKMGLAPLHMWLPDAYAEAPAPASALFSGALSNVAFLGVVRTLPVLESAGQGAFARGLLIALGLTSLLVSATFVVYQRDVKRMLAYSSIENYGVIALGVGLGGLGTYGALLHAVNHSLAKTLLFLVAGNVLVLLGTRDVGRLRGLGRRAPWTAALLAGGFLAITGAPPFGLFWSEFTVVRAALAVHPWVAVTMLVLLGAAFVGMARIVLSVLHGGDAADAVTRESPGLVLAPAVLFCTVLVLGCVVPPPLHALLTSAARAFGG
ncbi:MAG: proton-conducting transporter membrane subunit [Deferrisomatales bacterium]|nr:proton-conducting transporter membrane subunit [Deferrisomatales bacterium]